MAKELTKSLELAKAENICKTYSRVLIFLNDKKNIIKGTNDIMEKPSNLRTEIL